VQSHLVRLPIRAFDATQTGQLVSRVMSDAEGIRNLVGTGLVQLVGGFITAIVAFAWLMALNWRLTSVTAVLLFLFGGFFFSDLPVVKTQFHYVIVAIVLISVIPVVIEFVKARKEAKAEKAAAAKAESSTSPTSTP